MRFCFEDVCSGPVLKEHVVRIEKPSLQLQCEVLVLLTLDMFLTCSCDTIRVSLIILILCRYSCYNYHD